MNENTQDTTEQGNISSPLDAGLLLREKREGRGLSVEEVANAIKLQPRQVVAMESGDFASLGSPPFARGFVRNYARFIGFDAAPVLAGLEQQPSLPQHELGEGDGDGPRVAMPEPGRRKPMTWILAISPLILVAVVGAGLYAFGLNLDGLHLGGIKSSSEAAKPVEAAPSLQVVQQPAGIKPEASPQAPAESPAAQPGTAVMPQPALSSNAVIPGTPVLPAMPANVPAAGVAVPAKPSAVVAPAAPAAAPSAPAVAAPGVHHLVVSVETESWVEVKSEGRSVLSRKFGAGQSQSLDGKGPFIVVIGAAKGAKVQYDDKPVDLEPHTKVNVARLTLN